MVLFPSILESEAFSWVPDRLTDISSWHGHIPFAFAVVQLARPRVLVELGTHKGDSFCAFCQAIQKTRLKCSSYAVDLWEGDEHSGFYGSEVFEELKHYHDPRYGEFSTLLKASFDEALCRFQDRSIDLLHIDGLHSFEAVKHDFESWLPKMSSCGIILFHDIHVKRNSFGVWKLWESLKKKYPSFEFSHSNGLGVLGVGAHLPSRLSGFFQSDPQISGAISLIFEILGERIRQMSLNVDMKRHIAHFESEIKSFQTYTGQLESRIQEQEDELKNRKRYIGNLEDRIEEGALENQKKGEYIWELENRNHEIFNNYELRGNYILELESLLSETKEEIKEVISTNTILANRLGRFEKSMVCSSWIGIMNFLKKKWRCLSSNLFRSVR
jgi:hypothetical protein